MYTKTCVRSKIKRNVLVVIPTKPMVNFNLFCWYFDFLKMALIDKVLLNSKFRASLVGALMGDCLGSPYQDEGVVSKRQLQSYFDKMEEPYVKTPYKPYTDDTAMTRCIAKSIIEKKVIDEADIAKKFVTEYFKEPNRGYGVQVTVVFDKLLNTKIADPFGPAKEQFNGSGSYGNGAAMRTAPVALFHYDDPTALISMVSNVAKITHSHKLGINGAVLQSLAVRKSLLLNPKEKLDIENFATELINEMKNVEKDDDSIIVNKYSYENQLIAMKSLLLKENPADEEIITTLGNSVSSIFSVPTAIYSFLRANNAIPNIDTSNPFRRTLQYAISLGGDTDTIASMAGAIAGAYYGMNDINENLQKHCEKVDEATQMADQLFKLKHG